LLYNIRDLLLREVPSKVLSFLKSPSKDLITLEGLTKEVPKDLLAVRTPSKDQPTIKGLFKDPKLVKDLIVTSPAKGVPFKALTTKESLTPPL
jgi:hypothetical protein